MMKKLWIATLTCLVSAIANMGWASEKATRIEAESITIAMSDHIGMDEKNDSKQRILIDDLQKIAGPLWRGQLTYLDYSANVLRSIPSNLLVARSAEDGMTWLWSYGYDDEPHANAKDGVRLSEDGRQLGKETLLERRMSEDGTLTIITAMAGQDDHRAAQFRFTYTVAATSFVRQKEVKLDSGGDYFVRHTYSWKR